MVDVDVKCLDDDISFFVITVRHFELFHGGKTKMIFNFNILLNTNVVK